LAIDIFNSENSLYLHLSADVFDKMTSIHTIMISQFSLSIHIQFCLNHTILEYLIQ
ncbi:hypothetical protein EMCG_02501, partial [[Emmonsia] crescens]